MKKRQSTCLLAFIAFSVTIASSSHAQLESGWRAHDLNRPAPTVVDPGESKLPAGIPSDATVLFDGTDLSAWASNGGSDAKWKIVDGAMESVPGSGYVFTREKFGDCQLHVEWASPEKVKGDSQGRGNSGVYLMGKYEVQVLDSFDNITYADGGAGSLYGQYPPLVNASRRPGQWQSYDIVFRRPRFSESGGLEKPATVTVFHNGIVIQDASKLYGPTSWVQHKDYEKHEDQLPLSLQDHGNPVRYRNIWIRPLQDRMPPAEPYETADQIYEMEQSKLQKFVGRYGKYPVKLKNGKLYLIFHQQPLELIPLAENRFAFRKSAGDVEFMKDETGEFATLELRLDATGKRRSKKAEQE